MITDGFFLLIAKILAFFLSIFVFLLPFSDIYHVSLILQTILTTFMRKCQKSYIFKSSLSLDIQFQIRPVINREGLMHVSSG